MKKTLTNFILCFFFLVSGFVYGKNNIFEGDIVNPDEFPFVGRVYHLAEIDGHEEYISYCAGTVINAQWILTASHCIAGEEPHQIFAPKTLKFRLGSLDKVAVEKVFTYNLNGRDMDYDIALLKLTLPLNVKPVAIPETPEEFSDIKSSRHILAVGYGYSKIEWVKYEEPRTCPAYGAPCYFFYLSGSEDMRKGAGVTLNDEEVFNKIKQSLQHGDKIFLDYNPATMLGTYSPLGQHVLPGDSGGPLLLQTNRGYIQVGVTSWGPRLEGYSFAKEYREEEKPLVTKYLKSQPAFFANLTNKNILQFIYSTMRNN